jgi:PD-(D/E)XK nuclease superfamily
MIHEAPARTSQKVSLHTGASISAAWQNIILPWFKDAAPVAWQKKEPAAVLTPSRSHAHFLRALLLEHEVPLLGVHFLTPASLRDALLRESGIQLPLREHLRLLLAIAATEMSDDVTAKAVARSPGPFLRALDRLHTVGWKFEQLALASFAPLVRRFNELMKKCGFVLPGEIDRLRLQQATKSARKFSDILIAGFDGGHWANWFLLRTAVELAENATVILQEPHADFSEVDLCWIGSWEEIYGEAKRTTKPARLASDSLFSEAEMRGDVQQPTTRFDFLIATNASEQAEAIARQCLRYLAEQNCTRLGVIFPGAGTLPRLVASALARLDIPHNDGLAHIVPGIFESAEWQAWLELQRAPRLNSFLRLLNALPDSAVLSPKINRQSFENILRESYSELLLDDFELLREFCSARAEGKFQSVAEALRALSFLPPRATLPQFLEQTHAALALLGWKQRALEIENVTRDWPQRLDVKFSRSLFLRWLEETAATFGPARSPAGDHPYARVQLLTVRHAQNQEWSHLIFAGWNEGTWPPPASAEFAREEEIRAFNRSVQHLNKRAARQGSQGEGHTSVRKDHALYLGPIEQRALALRQFEALLESASEGVTLAASLVQEDAPERFWNPSECFTQLYFKARREPLTQATLKNLQRATALLPNAAPTNADAQQTLIAFNARRDASKPAGEYDFALRPNESYRPLPILSVSDLERMVSSPAIVWMKRYLGVEAPDDAGNPWAATSGKWVHRWLAAIGETRGEKIFTAFPTSPKIDERVRTSADERRATLQQLCDSLGKIVPDWWISGWLNARYLARHLGGKIAGAEGWKWMAAEYPIGREGTVKIADDVELQLRGQIDLILAQDDTADFAGQKIWIVDYKTGSTKEVKGSDLHDSLVKGTTLQLGLYALALRARGAAEVSASILSSAVRKVAPQLSVVDLAPHKNVFADLAVMQQSGVFGMKGELRPAFGYSATYPLATLPIDEDVLEDKWQRTHENLVLEKEEWEKW